MYMYIVHEPATITDPENGSIHTEYKMEYREQNGV